MLAEGVGGNGSTEPSSGVAANAAVVEGTQGDKDRQGVGFDFHCRVLLAVERVNHCAPAALRRRARTADSYFFGYAIFVVPMVPLKANGAWSK